MIQERISSLSIYSPSWDPMDSYGRKATELRQGLQSQGFYANALGEMPPLDQPIHPVLGGLLLGYPTGFHRYGAFANTGPKVAITAWESSKVPLGWVDSLNSCSLVSVGSEFTRQALVNSGVEVPVFVNHLGISSEFTYTPRETQDVYTFLAFTDRGMRKGWDIVIRAFVKAFGDSNDTRLILKSRSGWLPFRPANPNIVVIEDDMDNTRLAEFYQSIDCLVFPSRGEGFGLPPREFAATGGLVLATDGSGLQDYISEYAIPIPCSEEQAWVGETQFEGQDLGNWFLPDVDALADLMISARQDDLYTPAMSSAGSQRLQRLFSWKKFSEEIGDLWLSQLQI